MFCKNDRHKTRLNRSSVVVLHKHALTSPVDMSKRFSQKEGPKNSPGQLQVESDKAEAPPGGHPPRRKHSGILGSKRHPARALMFDVSRMYVNQFRISWLRDLTSSNTQTYYVRLQPVRPHGSCVRSWLPAPSGLCTK